MANTELDEAYAIVANAEKDLVSDLSALATEFKTKLAAIRVKQPEKGETSVARQFLVRIENNFNAMFTYDLESVRNSYGITSEPAAS